MKKIEITIKEKDKGARDLSLLNLREELVNFLYKDTIANSTKADLHFFVLLFFVSIKTDGKTFLEKILDEGIPKFNELNESFSKKKSYLSAREYRRMVNEHGLSVFFKNDIFFVLIEAVLNVGEMKEKFSDFLNENEAIDRVISSIETKYSKQLLSSFDNFKSSKIKDDRYDEYGNYHDLSKSVYRTVRMRNSRNLDLNLQRYTSVKRITSESPLDLTFFQHIDPQIIFDLWEKYHVVDYMKSILHFGSEYPIPSNIAANVLYDLVKKFINWKSVDGKKDRKLKDKTKGEFEISKRTVAAPLEKLTLRLVDSVLKADKRLEREIKDNRKQLANMQEKNITFQNKEAIKKLQERIKRLEGVSISTKLIDDK